MSIGQGWVTLGVVSFSGLLLLLHGGVLAVSIALLAKRHKNWSLRDLFRSRRTPLAIEAKIRL